MENFSIYFSNCFFTPVISFLLLISITPALSATINQLNNNEKDFPYKISEVEQRQTSSSLSVLTSEPSYKPTSKEELIYEIAIKYKQISRLSLLSCHKASSSENFEGMQTSSSSIQPTFSEQNEMPIAIKIDSITTNASKNYVDTASMLRYFFVRQNHHLLQEQENVHYFQRQQQHHEWNNAKSVLIKVIAIETILNPFYYNSSSCGMCNMSQNNTCSMNSDVDRVCSLHDYSSANNLFSRISKNETFHQFIILDMSCGYKNARKILELASSKAMFNAYYHWLLIDDYPHNRSKVDNNDKDSINNFYYNDGLMDEISQYKQDISFIENFLSDLNININTELILAQRKIDQDLWDYYQLFDVWNPGRHYYGKLNITNVGTFSQHNGLQMYNWYKSQTSVVRRMDMKNARIRCMVVVVYNQKNESLVPYLENREKPHLDSINHLTFAMVSYVRDMFNFQFDLQGTTTWGYLKNGTYDGMIGALMRNETDIGGSPIFFRTERAKLVDYTARISVLRNVGESVVKDLCVNLFGGSGRNIVCDNFFTSYNLAKSLMINNNLSILGTCNKRRTFVPAAFANPKRREAESSMFGFYNNVTMCSYVPNKNKAVVMLSTTHYTTETGGSKKKPLLHLK